MANLVVNLTVGNTLTFYGFTRGGFGAVDPIDVNGTEWVSIYTSTNNTTAFGFVTNDKIDNLDTLTISVDGNTYELDWVNQDYQTTNATLSQYFINNLGNTIPIELLDFEIPKPNPKLGDLEVDSFKLGDLDADAVYLGEELVWKRNKPIKLIAKDYYAHNYGASSYTFNNVNIGDATPTRKVVIGFSMRGGTSTGLTISVTVNGETPITLIKGSYSTTSTTVAQLDIIEMPEDINEVDIVISINRVVDRCGLGVWAIDNLETLTPIDVGESANSSATPLIGNVNTIEGGFVIGMSYDAGQSVKTWTGITEDFDLNGYFAGASDEVLIAETPRNVNCLQNTGVSSKLVTVSLGNK